jgi:transposase
MILCKWRQLWRKTSRATRRLIPALLEQFKWEIFEPPPYSSDLAPSDYDLFLNLKTFLTGQSLGSDQETKDVVQDQLKGLTETIFDEGIQKLVPRYDKCLNLYGDCVEK